MSQTNGFNLLFFKRCIRLLHIFLPFSRLSIDQYKERFYLHPLCLLIVGLLNEGVLQYIIYLVGLLPSKFYTELGKPIGERNQSSFHWLVARSFGLVILNALLRSLSTFFSSLLYVKWRLRLVVYLHSFYFKNQRFYHLSNTTNENYRNSHETLPIAVPTTNGAEQEHQSVAYIPTSNSRPMVKKETNIDNPDQRIAQDADSLCRTLSNIIPLIIISPFSIGYYTYRTWELTGFYGPLSIFVYFIIWTLINKIFISFVSRTIYQQNVAEGNFRFLHSQIRTHNEPIGFYHGDDFEHKRFDSFMLKILSPILYRRTCQEFVLSLSTNLFDYIGSILSYLLLALAMFVFHYYDDVDPKELIEVISQTSFIAMYLIYRFNLLNDLTDKITVIAANTHRVQSFVEQMNKIEPIRSQNLLINTNLDPEQILTIKNLSYSTPNNRKHILMKNLNLNLRVGQRILITGNSGVGKTSLFRVLHSLWPINIGGSFSYQSQNAYLLPQRPYFTNLSLNEELSYPEIDVQPTVQRLNQISRFLNEWNLVHILDYVDSNLFLSPKYSWQDLLSPGELQRLSFIRLLLRIFPEENSNSTKITLVFLDEITSSLDVEMEKKIYEFLVKQNLSLISIGHRESLRQFHQFELKLYENGRHEFLKLC